MKTVVVTGAQGQDASYLIEKYLAKEDYLVVGLDRWGATGTGPNLSQEVLKNPRFTLVTGDICDAGFIHRIFEQFKPDYFFNMAAISLVPESFRIPTVVFQTNAMAVLGMLEEIRNFSPKTRFLQASSSEQIGDNKITPQNTDSIMLPNSVYAVSKMTAYHLLRCYRQAYNLFTINSMCWNHESKKRGPDFVTRKITIAVAKIKLKQQEFVELGNLNSIRDWGSADDFTDAMILMMHAEKPDDFAIATGVSHSIRKFVEEAFSYIGETITWKGEGLNEVGINQNMQIRVKINEKFYRPVEVNILNGDYSKIKRILGWEPKTKFTDLVLDMVHNDIQLLK